MLLMADTPDASSTPGAPTLTTRERAALKARAHGLDAVVRVGHAGVTDAIVAEIDRALDAHELIKVKIGEGDRDERLAHAGAISTQTGAAIVQRVGRVLILWRPRPDAGSGSTG
jgi:RNA-binding protein